MQSIDAMQRVVFVGDSITAGTPPTPTAGYYRSVLVGALVERFGALEVDDCSAWGGQLRDLNGPFGQLQQCLDADRYDEPVLVIMTMGGNDLSGLASDLLEGATESTVHDRLDGGIADLEDALSWFRDEEPTRFPGGIHMAFTNVYEYTDGTGDLSSCPSAEVLGYGGVVPGARDLAVRLNESFVRLAVDYGFDVVFLLEHFCGRGFYADDSDNECFRGPDTETWFDGSCIHPTPVGHQQIAGLFMDVIDR